MLKGIPSILSPELLKILMEMGHGDEIILADGNFPAAAMAQRLVRADGHGTAALLEAVLKLLPLDGYVPRPVALMDKVPGDKVETPIWGQFAQIVSDAGYAADFEFVERFAFYERAKNAYAIVATGEGAQYANVILKKGIVK